MALWRSSALKLAVVAMSSMPQYNCDLFSDPATRLANCLSAAVKAQALVRGVIHASCDLKLAGRYIVVLHPPGTISNDDLVSAGLPEALLPELRAIRMRPDPAMYVIAADRTVTGFGTSRSIASSRTTIQIPYVQINELMIATRNSQPLIVAIGGPPAARVINRIR